MLISGETCFICACTVTPASSTFIVFSGTTKFTSGAFTANISSSQEIGVIGEALSNNIFPL